MEPSVWTIVVLCGAVLMLSTIIWVDETKKDRRKGIEVKRAQRYLEDTSRDAAIQGRLRVMDKQIVEMDELIKWLTALKESSEPELKPPFDPSRCQCAVLGRHAPCGYCESGEYTA